MSSDAAVAIKKPPSAFLLWLNKNREGIQKEIGSKAIKDVMAKASEIWKATSEQDRKPFEEESARLKEEFLKFKETDEGKAALASKKEEKQGKKQSQEARAVKAAVKAVEKDDNLKRPATAYWLWLNDNREKIKAELGEGHKITDVTKKGGAMWAFLSPLDKEPWEKKAKAAKDAHNEYLKSPEGEAALQAYKEATQAAKRDATSETAGKAMGEPQSPETKTPTKKRARKATDTPKEGKPERAVKKARGAKEAPVDVLSEEVKAACQAQQKAGEPSIEAMLRKLFETDKLVDFTTQQGLDALKALRASGFPHPCSLIYSINRRMNSGL